MIRREISQTIHRLFSKFPIVMLTGARQSGKTTLLRELFPDYQYVNCEDESVRNLGNSDITSFINQYNNHVIFDEAQRVPQLFSALQVLVDQRQQQPGQFIISGSQNFLLMHSISQSLAGRAAVLHLLPLSYKELTNNPEGGINLTTDQWTYTGGYPRLYDMHIDPEDYFPSYISTYLERDRLNELGVKKISEFRTFLTQCALHTGELVNYSSLAQSSGIDAKTAKDWISILETSFVVFRLFPYYTNLGKRLIKTPKLYFYDSGLAAQLIGLESAEELALSKYRGPLFENAVIAEIMKMYYANGKTPKLTFWRDTNKKEIDLIIEKGGTIQSAIEIKASHTYDSHAFANINSLSEQLGLSTEQEIVIYGGNQSFDTKFGRLLTVNQIPQLF